jgi:hypothetical protein
MLRSEPAAERCLRAFVRRVLAISDKAEQPLGLFASLRRRPGRSMRADSEETVPTEHAVLDHVSGVAALATDAKAPDRLTVAGKTALAAAKARGVKLGNPNGARALKGKQVGNADAVRVGHVCGHEVHAAFLEARDEVQVSRKPVETGYHELCSRGLGVTDGCLQLRAGVALAAFHLNVFGHELPAATIEIPGHRVPLSFQPKATAALLVGRYA